MLQNREKIDEHLRALRAAAPDNDLDQLEGGASGIRELVSEMIAPVKDETADLDTVLKELSDEYPAPEFWENIRQRAIETLLPYQETAFLRAMDEPAQREYLSAAFESLVRCREPDSYLCDKLGVTREQLGITLKVYNTFIEWIMTRRMSKRLFLSWGQDYFGMSDSLITFIWELIDDNRPMLAERTVLNYLEDVRRFIGQIGSLIENFVDRITEEDEEDEEDDSDEDI